jgi:predicted DNA-binding transcriptional regulator AlpA
MIAMEKILFNAKEACCFLGVSKSTLLRLSDANKLKKIQVSERRVAWRKQDLEIFVANLPTATSQSK